MDDHSHLYPEAHGERMGRVDSLRHDWDENTMEDKRLLNYMAPMDTEMSDDIEMIVNGNLGSWLDITYARTTKEGSKLLFDLIHTVTGERIPLPKKSNNYFTVVVDEVQDPPCCLSISAIATFEHSRGCDIPSRHGLL